MKEPPADYVSIDMCVMTSHVPKKKRIQSCAFSFREKNEVYVCVADRLSKEKKKYCTKIRKNVSD